jgi:hypothetical protein
MKQSTLFSRQLFSVDSYRGTLFYLTGVGIIGLPKPIKQPKSVSGTFKLSQSTAKTKTSEIGTIAARFVSIYSHMSITNKALARKNGRKELDIRVSKIQCVPLKNL